MSDLETATRHVAGVDPHPLLEAEDQRALDFFDGLDAAAWEVPTDCPGWRRREMLAHLAGAQDYNLSTLDGTRSEFIAISTVRTHIASVLDKLGVASQVEAVARAREFGWPPTIPPPSDTLGPGFRQRARRGRPSGSEGG